MPDQKPPQEPAPPAAPATPQHPFPIIGIGASAGGLEAFEHFFANVPADCAMAFVLVPHLDPDHASILSDILQRSSALPVTEAVDGMKVSPGHVYVIPPNRDMRIAGGALRLSEPDRPRGQRMPIDSFLRSLAADQGVHAAGIILSGTGTDGTLGLRAIDGAGGIALIQDPSTAKYDGMPTSAIRAGYATHVLPVEKMPQVLLGGPTTRLMLDAAASRASALASASSGNALTKILLLLRSGTGHDFSLYKKSTVARRIARRMSQHDIEDEHVYARYLKEHPAEQRELFRALLINVTSMFRDPDAFEALKREVLAPLLGKKTAEDAVVRVWIAGCASGEEAYSIAILLRELMDESSRTVKVQIYATDLDEDAIAVARAGIYPPNIAADVSPERMHRFFVKDGSSYRVKKEIREMIVFAVQNVIKDPPFTRLDLLSCRNLMIYLEPELQHRMLLAFHYALVPDGVLFLSPSETIGNQTELFAPLNRKWRLYTACNKTAAALALRTSNLPWTAIAGAPPRERGELAGVATSFAELTRSLLLQTFSPPSVMTDLRGDILFVHGDTGRYLRPAPGQATLNAVGMARPGLQIELLAAIHSADQGTSVLEREVAIQTNGEPHPIRFSVRRLADPETGQSYLLISFHEQQMATTTVEAASKRRGRAEPSTGIADQRRIEVLERDLAYTREKLQATIEEQQAANEELKAANEEMQSTNEELQSTNEELETSKEELQSVNEELLTVNAELQAKVEQLADIQNDMKNLLDYVGAAVVFLDSDLKIRRFTRDAARIYRLVPADVGRPLADIKSDLEGGDLLSETRTVLDTLVACEREVRTVGGASYLARIQPYRTLDNLIEGVVLSFTDITQRIAAEARVQAARKLAEAIVDTVREPLVVLDDDLRVVSASRSFFKVFGVTPVDTTGRLLYELGDRQWDIPVLRDLLQKVLPKDRSFDDYVVEHDFPGLGHMRMQLSARRIVGDTIQTRFILLAIQPLPAMGT